MRDALLFVALLAAACALAVAIAYAYQWLSGCTARQAARLEAGRLTGAHERLVVPVGRQDVEAVIAGASAATREAAARGAR